MISPAQIPALHEQYCAFTRLALPWSMQRLYTWEHWISRGHTEAELKLVVWHIQKQHQNKSWMTGMLKFSKLIGDTEYFEEQLAEAVQAKRNSRPATNRDQVLRQSGRNPALDPRPVKTVDQIMRESEVVRKFAEWRKESGI